MRKIFGPFCLGEGWLILNNNEHMDGEDIELRMVRFIKARKLGWLRHVICMRTTIECQRAC